MAVGVGGLVVVVVEEKDGTVIVAYCDGELSGVEGVRALATNERFVVDRIVWGWRAFFFVVLGDLVVVVGWALVGLLWRNIGREFKDF